MASRRSAEPGASVLGPGASRRLTANWREEIAERWGIGLLEDGCVGRVLWCSRCAAGKARGRGHPDELYISALLAPFYRFVREAKVRFGVLSDLYGLHLDDECLPAYNVHPSSLTPERKTELGRMIGDKARAGGFETLVFYAISPVRSVPYFEMLGASKLRVCYTTRIPR